MARPKNPCISVTVSESLLEKINLLGELTGLTSTPSAARYLIVRGIESMTPKLKILETTKKIEEKFTPEEMLPLFEKISKESDFLD